MLRVAPPRKTRPPDHIRVNWPVDASASGLAQVGPGGRHRWAARVQVGQEPARQKAREGYPSHYTSLVTVKCMLWSIKMQTPNAMSSDNRRLCQHSTLFAVHIAPEETHGTNWFFLVVGNRNGMFRYCITLGPHEAGVWAKHPSLMLPAPSRGEPSRHLGSSYQQVVSILSPLIADLSGLWGSSMQVTHGRPEGLFSRWQGG